LISPGELFFNRIKLWIHSTIPENMRTRYLVAACVLGLLFSVGASAQTFSSNAQTANATYTVVTADPLAISDEPFALGDALIRELRRGGYVLYLRHGTVNPGSTDTRGTGEWWKNCATTQRLAPQSFPQAQAVGQALARQRILMDEVLTSEFCRAYDTAVLLGNQAPKQTAALNAFTAFESQKKSLSDLASGIQQLLSTPVALAGRNRLLVGHTLPATIVHPVLSTLGDGQTAIFRPEGNNRFHLVAVLSPGQWQSIGKLAVVDTPTAPQVTIAPPPSVPQPPVIDPAKEIKGAALLKALRQGGYNLYMRHALATLGTDQDLLKVPMWWDNCAIQRNLSDAGREQARKVGTSLRELNIPISAVKVAQFCRTRDTGYLLGLGPLEIDEGLNHVIGQRVGFDVNGARFKLLAEVPATGSNAFLVSHTHGSARPEERVMGGMQEAEVVVFQPDGKGGSTPVARIPLTEWDNLIKLTNPAKS
jgi:broad specificity phosphatase PhoE